MIYLESFSSPFQFGSFIVFEISIHLFSFRYPFRSFRLIHENKTKKYGQFPDNVLLNIQMESNGMSTYCVCTMEKPFRS